MSKASTPQVVVDPGATTPSASTYQERMANQEPVDLDAFYQLFAEDQIAEDMYQVLVDNDHSVSTYGFLALVGTVAKPRVILLHSAERVRTPILQKDPLRGKVIAIQSDTTELGTVMRNLEAGSLIMYDCEGMTIPKDAQYLEACYSSADNVGKDLLEPYKDGEDKTGWMEVTVLEVCPLPPQLVMLFLKGRYLPKECHDMLHEYGKAEGCLKGLEYPLRWCRAACTLQTTSEGKVLSPTMMFGNEHEALPMLDPTTPYEADYIARRLNADLPGRHRKVPEKGPNSATGMSDEGTKALLALVASQQEATEATLKLATASTERSHEKKKQTWEDYDPHVLERLCRLVGVEEEADLPEAWAEIIRGKSSGMRSRTEKILQREYPKLRLTTYPVFSAELAEIVLQGNWGLPDNEEDHYDKAFTPLAMISSGSDLGKLVVGRNRKHDLAFYKETAKTDFDKLDELTTKELPLPRDLRQLTSAFKAYDVALHVFMGAKSEVTQSWDDFIKGDWQALVDLVEEIGNKNKYDNNVWEAWLKIGCQASAMLVDFFNQRLAGRDPIVPNFKDLTNIVRRKQWARVEYIIPQRYTLQIPPAPTPAPPGGESGNRRGRGNRGGAGPGQIGGNSGRAGGGGDTGTSTVTTPPGQEGTTTGRPLAGRQGGRQRPEETNPDRNTEWKASYDYCLSKGVAARHLYNAGGNPKTTRGGREFDMCLGYNLGLRCSGNCRRRPTHFGAAAQPEHGMEAIPQATEEELTKLKEYAVAMREIADRLASEAATSNE